MGGFNRREFIQASAASLLLDRSRAFALQVRPAGLPGDSAAYARTNVEGKSWTIGNPLVAREIRFEPAAGLSTAVWRHEVTGTDFMEPARKRGVHGDEFSFLMDKESFAGSKGSAWEIIEAKINTPAHSELLSIHLRSRAKPIDVTAFYSVSAGHPVVQKWIAITNSGAEPVTLSHLVFESVNLAPGLPDVLQAAGFYGVQPRELFFTGRVDDTAVIEKNSLTGEGFIAMNGAPGYTKRTELVEWGEGVQLMYDTDLFPFERSLEPGETFTSAKSSIAFFSDGKGFADSRWVMPTYTSQVLMKKGAGYRPPGSTTPGSRLNAELPERSPWI